MNIPATKVFSDTWAAIQSKQYKLIVQEGSSRSSKTWGDFLILYLIAVSRQMITITVLRDTAIDCRDIVETEWIKWATDPLSRWKELEDGKISIQQYQQYIRRENLLQYFVENKTKHTWTAKTTGSVIRFTGLDDEDKVMGMTQNICWINEPYRFPHEVYKQLSQRTSDFILLDWNPKKTHWVEQEKQRNNTITLKSTYKDNPFCPDESRKQIESYQPVRACSLFKRGAISDNELFTYDVIANPASFPAWEIAELVRCRYNEKVKTASDYHWSVFGLGEKAERPNRIFRWEKMDLADYYALQLQEYYYSDWGMVDPWAVGAGKYRDGCLYLHELNYDSENVIRERLTTTERAQIDGQEEGMVSWMFEKMNVPKTGTIVCDPNRRLKILALRQAGWEYAIAAPKPPGSIIDGISLLSGLRVYYTHTSENIEHEQENYSRKVNNYGEVLEEPEDIDNHHIDGSRYLATFLQNEGVIRGI